VIDDILTVVWKERKGLFRVQGRRSQAIMTLLSPVFLAVFLPWQVGLDWVERSMSLLLAFIVSFILVGITIPDAFAGERERHTLPTLLASRLPDRAIVLGKMATSVAFGWGVTCLVLLLSLIAVNVIHWQGHVVLFRPMLLLADLSVSLLVCLFVAGLGVLFSMRSSTVQQAQQLTMSVMLFPAMAVQVLALFLLQSASLRARLNATVGSLSFGQFVGVIVMCLAVPTAVLLWAALARFKRARLILSE
jgi:ABC-2 type transport system permease protein